MSDFLLKLDPAERIDYVGRKLGEEPTLATLKVANTTKDRLACKVKCTSNEMFRIRPPVFALKGEEEATVKLTFNAGKTVPDSGKHYFAVYYIKASDDSKAPRAAWSEHKGDPDGTKRLYVHFKKEEGEEKKEEKKGGEKKEEKKEEEKKEEKKEEEKKEEKKDDERKEEKKEEEKKEEKKEEEKKEEKEGEKKEEEKKEDEKKEEDKKDEKEGEKKDDEKNEDEKKEEEKK